GSASDLTVISGPMPAASPIVMAIRGLVMRHSVRRRGEGRAATPPPPADRWTRYGRGPDPRPRGSPLLDAPPGRLVRGRPERAAESPPRSQPPPRPRPAPPGR